MQSELAAEEYRALRAAIAARGQLRTALFLGGIALWSLVLLATLAFQPYPVASAVPLVVLVATFEVVRPLHLGAERIGRYLQVFFEEANGTSSRLDPPAWERTAMAFGPTVPGAGGHPLFVPLFVLAVAVNSLAVLLPQPLPIELTTMAVPHAAFLVWIVRADRAMRRQRATELARFRELREQRS